LHHTARVYPPFFTIARFRLWRRKAGRAGRAFFARVGIVCACLSLFVALANGVRAGELQPLEERIMPSLRSPAEPRLARGPAWLEGLAHAISALGGPPGLTLATETAVRYQLLLGRRRPALFVSVAAVGGTALSSGLKAFFERARPGPWLYLTPVHSARFPSGPSLRSSVVFLPLRVMVSRLLSRRAQKIFGIFLALPLSFLAGFSSIFLDVHHPTGVLSGWTAGMAWALVCAMVFARRTAPDR
jgi:undecaprenyl-diphosphatase